jgi:Xaa-Pro aminopeptidase
MRTDLDRLMHERNLDWLIVAGTDGLAEASSNWLYMTRGQKLTGHVLKPRGRLARILFHPMEIQQAQASGLEQVSMGRWDLKAIAKSHPTRLGSSLELWKQIIVDQQIAGRVAWFGAVDASHLLPLIDGLRELFPQIQFVGEYENSVIDVARRTKDANEIVEIESVCRRTCEVFDEVRSLLSGCRAVDGLLQQSGTPLTIGRVKQFIRAACDARALEMGDVIFSQGRDAGIGHASGDVAAVVRVAQPIVFDLFPRCRESGFYADITRTLCPGHADEQLLTIYNDVLHAFDTIRSELRAGTRCKVYQDRCCALLHQRGHLTVEQQWPLEEGYNHSLGHGLGLEVHEPLVFSSFADRGDTLEAGNVFTIEPGLYYPSRSIGVRIEDTLVCDPDGSFRSLTQTNYDLIVPTK